MPSVKELVGANSLQSPLTQLRVGVESRRDDVVSLRLHVPEEDFRRSRLTRLAIVDPTYEVDTVHITCFIFQHKIDSTARPAHRL